MKAFNTLSTDGLAQTLWEYMLMHHQLASSDVILVLGSNDVRVAEHGADLFLLGLAPLIVFSGNVGKLTAGLFLRSEAETFAEIAKAKGVPEQAIVLEPQATNTGENLVLSRNLLAARGVLPRRVIVVQKPYMERRAYATFRRLWPEPEVCVTSPPISWADYPNAQLPQETIIHILVGDVQRMRVYADKGFQIPQPIPDDVWAAWEELVARGYTDHLVEWKPK